MGTTSVRFDEIKFHEDIKNPREELKDIEELVASIRAVGLQVPLTVLAQDLRTDDGAKKELYYLVVGFRRYEAIRMIREQDPDAFKTVEVKRFKGSVAEAQVLNLTENIQRSDLTPFEIANGVEILLNLGYSQKDIADKVGKSQTWVSNAIQFRRSATPQLKNAVKEGVVSYGFARQIATLEDRDQKRQIEHIVRTAILDEGSHSDLSSAGNGESKVAEENSVSPTNGGVAAKKVDPVVRKEVRETSGRAIRPSTIEIREEINRISRTKEDGNANDFDLGILTALTWTLGERKTLRRPS